MSTDLQLFLKYCKSQKKYFGKEYLNSCDLLYLYLNYDVRNNFVRKYLKENTKKSNEEINRDVFEVMKTRKEPYLASKQSQLPIELKFSSTLVDTINTVSVRMNELNLNTFIYNVLIDDSSGVRKMLYALGLNENQERDMCEKFAKECIDSKSPEYPSINEKISDVFTLIDGKIENYKYEGRSSIYEVFWPHLLKRTRNNLAIDGEDGIGRKPLVYGMAYESANNLAPKGCNGLLFYQLDLKDLFPQDEKQILKKIKLIQEFMENTPNSILFIDNCYMLFDDMALNNYGFYYSMIPILFNKKIKVIFTVDEEASKIFTSIPKFLKAYTLALVEDPEDKKLRVNLVPTIKLLTFYHGVKFSSENFKNLNLYAHVFHESGYTFNYMKDLIDLSMVNAKMHNRDEISTEDIKAGFKAYFKAYEKQPEEIKKMVAIHEAGHYVVSRFTKEARSMVGKYITVIPKGDAGGFNVFDYDNTKAKIPTYEYYLDYIAIYLGGRAAEEIFIQKTSSGAESDLQYANELANAMVSELALDQNLLSKVFKFSKIKANENMQTEASLNRVSRRATITLQRAYSLAQKILICHQDYVLGLADYLLKHKVVETKDLRAHEVVETDSNGKKHLCWKD